MAFKKTLAALASMTILAGCGGSRKLTSEQVVDFGVTECPEPVRPPLCGGYTKQREISEEELNLFRNTMKDDRYTPLSVATQVVSGINYRFFCSGPDGDVVVTIYKPLHDAPRVTEMSK